MRAWEGIVLALIVAVILFIIAGIWFFNFASEVIDSTTWRV